MKCLVLVIGCLLSFSAPASADWNLTVSPNAGAYVFDGLDTSAVGGGVSALIHDRKWLDKGLRIGIGFVTPSVDLNTRSVVCERESTIKPRKVTMKESCRIDRTSEDLHLTNIYAGLEGRVYERNNIRVDLGLGADLWSSNLSENDLGMRVTGQVGWVFMPGVTLDLGLVYSFLAEAELVGETLDIDNFYAHAGLSYWY